MRILAVDTATEACSAALLCGGEIIERYRLDPRGHSRRLMPMIEALLAEAGVIRADLDGIAYDRGPGSFTGIRIGAGVAQGLALGLNRPLLGLSSLTTLAEEVKGDRVLSAIDARMGEVYWAKMKRDPDQVTGWSLLCEATVSDPSKVPALESGEIGTGSGWDRYHATLCPGSAASKKWLPERFPRAAAVARLAGRVWSSDGFGSTLQTEPDYVRDQVTG